MKYEYLAGNPAMFIGMPSRVVVLVNAPHSVEGLTSFGDVVKTGMPVIAMRRIIQEPKRWTVEDQKAGRLPDVGTKAMQVQGFCVVDVLSAHHGYVVVCNSEIDDARPVVFEENRFLELFKPIETPEEKAQRLRSEWCSECTSKYYPRGHKGFPEMIYDALLSGALSVPTKGGE